MVRTRADNTARKSVAAKAPRKNFNAGSSSSSTSPSSGKGNRYSGGNPYCPRPTPDWQKEITKFFTKVPRTNQLEKENLDPEDAGAGSSKMEGNATSSSSKTSDKSKVKRSKKETTDAKETTSKEEGEKQVEENEMMEVEIEIVDKKQTPEKMQSRESPKSFKRNNCISDDSDEDDD